MKHESMMSPPIGELLDKAGSKFTLVTMGSKRARQINSYFNQLGDGLGTIVPPQVSTQARKPLSVAFEEIAVDKIGFEVIDPVAEAAAVEAEAQARKALAVVQEEAAQESDSQD